MKYTLLIPVLCLFVSCNDEGTETKSSSQTVKPVDRKQLEQTLRTYRENRFRDDLSVQAKHFKQAIVPSSRHAKENTIAALEALLINIWPETIREAEFRYLFTPWARRHTRIFERPL